MRTRSRLVAAATGAALAAGVLAGCASDPAPAPAAPSSAPAPVQPNGLTTASATADGTVAPGVVVQEPDPAAGPLLSVVPANLVTPAAGSVTVVTLKPGDTASKQVGGPGDTVVANYVGVGGNRGEVFDSSWLRGAPATFPMNAVIKGWTQGLQGAHVGERRLLIIPGDMAYGDNPPTGIDPNETLVFVVDVVDVNPEPAG